VIGQQNHSIVRVVVIGVMSAKEFHILSMGWGYTMNKSPYIRLERRELLILQAKRYALNKIGDECSDLLHAWLTTEHDQEKAWAKFSQKCELFKDAYLDHIDQQRRVEEMRQRQVIEE